MTPERPVEMFSHHLHRFLSFGVGSIEFKEKGVLINLITYKDIHSCIMETLKSRRRSLSKQSGNPNHRKRKKASVLTTNRETFSVDYNHHHNSVGTSYSSLSSSSTKSIISSNIGEVEDKQGTEREEEEKEEVDGEIEDVDNEDELETFNDIFQVKVRLG